MVAANHEFSSGQFEINMWHGEALDAADRAHRFKAAIKELAGARAGWRRSCRSRSTTRAARATTCTSLPGPITAATLRRPAGPNGLSRGGHDVAGILAHAPALAAIANPTMNSYKRFGPDTLAPWLIDWGLDNRSAMVRIPPERGGASRLELRLGTPARIPI